MSWFRRRESKPPPAGRELLVPGGFEVEVVGESNYQDAIAEVAGRKTEDSQRILTQAHLVPEPTNPYDPGAIAVQIAGRTVGYLNRSAAKTYAPVAQALVQQGITAVCQAWIVGGWERGEEDSGSWGVRLDIATPDEILRQLRGR